MQVIAHRPVELAELLVSDRDLAGLGLLFLGENDVAAFGEEDDPVLGLRHSSPHALRGAQSVDRVAGAAHFEVPVSTGRELIAQLRARLPGYAVPRYVREVAQEAGKVVLA